MDNFVVPSNLIVGEELLAEARLMAEEKKNKPDEETELNEHIDGSNKRRRPTGDSNKDLSECKKAKKSPSKDKPNRRGRPAGKDKKSPKKRVNLKIMSVSKNGKQKNFTRLYKKPESEICIICREEYIQETPVETAGQDKPDKIKICRSCRICLADEVVINEIRDIIKKRKIAESDEANKKIEYFCGICQNKIKMNCPTILCIKCNKWVHKRCVSIPWEKAVKNKHDFKCKNCEGGDKTPEEENVPNVMSVEELTNKILLSDVCANGENSNLHNIDLKSLENGGWVTDSIIAHVFGKIQQYVNESKLALVKPSITQIL